jgi:Mg-chelatase subunit ChlD
MKLTKTLLPLLLSGLVLAPAAFAAPDPSTRKIPVPSNAIGSAEPSRDVDLVICLDTSGSMQGLIDSCRKKLWDMCSLLGQARPQPRLRVALVAFGDTRNPDGGHVVIDSVFTEELDGVYEKLMALTTNGSTELVGRALHESLTQLEWSTQSNALKMIFVAGNESADQDSQYSFREQVKRALQQNVIVNAIYCGKDTPGGGDAATWRELATLGGGQYAAIDQEGTIAIATPFDAEISRLGGTINGTYLAYGHDGVVFAARQEAQDENAKKVSKETLAGRMQLKGSSLYRNGSWDLVDRCNDKDFDWSKVPDKDLPKELKGKSLAERDAFIKTLRAKRTAIQKELLELGKKRTSFIAAELTKRAGENARSLDFVLAKAVKEAAEASGFAFE